MNPINVQLPWHDIDTVLLDMDGAVLDLHFDNFFWLELVPRRYAQQNQMTLEQARVVLTPMFAAKQGTLEWYCTDYWARELAIDIVRLKHDMREQVKFLPGAREFLQALIDRGVRSILVTNAHPDTLAVKLAQTGLHRYFQTIVSSHRFGAPKEHDVFWERLVVELRYDPARTLFVDDTLSVLRAAQRHGIAHLFAVTHPDSTQPPRSVTEFQTIRRIAELLGPVLESDHSPMSALDERRSPS